MLSYDRKDVRKCQRLFNRLAEEDFSVGIESNRVENQRRIYSEMDKAECIILCISENYYRNLSCVEEAQYACQTDKKFFVVRIEYHTLFGWDYDLFEGKLFFRTFGSDNYFDLEYERLLVELVR